MTRELIGGAAVGTTFNRGLEIYKKNFVPLLLATLLALVVGGISCGICTAPLLCGVYAMVLAAMRDGNATLKAGDVFKGFQKFVPAFVSCLVLGVIYNVVCMILMIIPILGWIAVIILGLAAFPAIVSWSQLLVTDQDASVGEAIMVPIKLLRDKRFWSIVLVTFVASLLGGLGAIACGIGLFATLPFAFCMIAAAYEEAYGAAAPVAVEPPAAEPPAAEPPAAETPAS